MEILLDASSLNYQLSGIGYYCYNLYKSLLEESDGSFNFYMLFLHREICDDSVLKLQDQYKDNVIYLQDYDKKFFRKLDPMIPRGKRFLIMADDWIRNKALKSLEARFDIYHGQDYLFNIFPDTVNTTTIYDLTTELFPQLHDQGNVLRNKIKLSYIQDKCSSIFCISESTRKDLLKLFPKTGDKTLVSYPSCHPLFDAPGDLPSRKELLKKYHIQDSPYLLSVCTIEPRKNLIQVLDVFAKLKEGGGYNDLVLILVGGYGWNNQQFDEILQGHPNKDDIYLAGYVPLKDLPAFYKNAEVFLYLSFYEGFGLPVLEAMKSGCPVVASNTSSIPEIAGDSSILCDLKNTENILQKVERMMRDREYREKIVQAGISAGRKFKWERSAHEHFDRFRILIK